MLHDARPVLLNFDEQSSLDITPRADCVRQINATYAGP